MKLIQISALSDNIIWLLTTNNNHCIIVDPGEASPVLDFLSEKQLTPVAILLTHHHYDHVGGVSELHQHYPSIAIYGPEETTRFGTTHTVKEGDCIEIEQFTVEVIATPGHTKQHVSFYQAPYLFCGDTLFSGGCGRLFEGTAQQLFHSLEKLAQLPDDTLVCCAHEYTQSNLNFSHYFYPDNAAIYNYWVKINKVRQTQQSTLPSTMKKEREINVFLKCNEQEIQSIFDINTEKNISEKTFTLLRQLKDQF